MKVRLDVMYIICGHIYKTLVQPSLEIYFMQVTILTACDYPLSPQLQFITVLCRNILQRLVDNGNRHILKLKHSLFIKIRFFYTH